MTRTLESALPESEPVPIHRDFYPDNVLVNGDKLYLIDLDLYCLEDRALDAGNMVGHIMEYSIRKFSFVNYLLDNVLGVIEGNVLFSTNFPSQHCVGSSFAISLGIK